LAAAVEQLEADAPHPGRDPERRRLRDAVVTQVIVEQDGPVSFELLTKLL
jgi:hypothetical protein